MEVGAVKQAFNNELILLKKKLNQAKTQIIHKLTRKAKTLTEKKAPDHMKDKLKRKAEAAVSEVLILKKIKARDIGKFIVTHTGKLQDYLNKPEVDQNKACARILLHKAMQEKYAFIRNRFSDVPIKDLFMSRQERLKLKKEAREKKKEKENKKREKQKKKAEAGEGGWDVEDFKISDADKTDELSDKGSEEEGMDESGSDDDDGIENSLSHLDKEESENRIDEANDNEVSGDDENEQSDENHDQEEIGKFVRVPPMKKETKVVKKAIPKVSRKSAKENIIAPDFKEKPLPETKVNEIPEIKLKIIEQEIKKKQEKKVKDNKNKNFNEKILQRKFKKDVSEPVVESNKVMDPFFITSTGENYMSVAEPRLPDEVKEIHKQGNRKQRRAAMFGHVPKHKPRNEGYNPKNNFDNSYTNNKFENNINSKFDKTNNIKNDDRFNSQFKKDKFNKHNQDKSDNRLDAQRGFKRKRLDDRLSDNERSSVREDRNPSRGNIEDAKEEKLHPSWEAKKRQSGILPFQGKKIVFDED